MGIEEDLRAVGDRARRDLIAVHDFFARSVAVWANFEVFVRQGHTFSHTNPATGNTVDQHELIHLTPDYLRRYLTVFTFKQFVSSFEVFFFDFLHRLARHNPWQFARSQLGFEVVLNAADRDEVIAAVLAKQLNELKYERPREWFAALNKIVKLDSPADDAIDTLAEIKATRDVLEHNSGLVNETYVRKAGKKARFAAGDFAEIDEPYHLASWSLLHNIADDLTTAALARLAP